MDHSQLSVKERAALFALLTEVRPIFNLELEERVGFRLVGGSRERLNDLRLVKTDEKSRPFVHELTDAGWRWCADRSPPRGRSDAKSIESALYALLAVFGRYLQVGFGLSLADVVKVSQEPVPAAQKPADVEARIMSAYHELAAKQARFVKLAELRSRLADLPRAAVDAALNQMCNNARVNLVPQSSPRALSDADREAVGSASAGRTST